MWQNLREDERQGAKASYEAIRVIKNSGEFIRSFTIRANKFSNALGQVRYDFRPNLRTRVAKPHNVKEVDTVEEIRIEFRRNHINGHFDKMLMVKVKTND